MIFVHILTFLLFIYLFATVSYLLLLALAGRFGRLNAYSVHPKKARIAVIIPSHKEDNVIVDTASQALSQDYPADMYTVTVIADHLRPETITRLKELPINLVEVYWEKSMKAKSLNAAFGQLPAGYYDICLILDADNVMSAGCLQKINHAFQSGWKAIQCHRTAKNKNNSVAILDAMSEEMNNTIFRRGPRALGWSSALIGSGMAFEYDLLKEIFALPQIQDNPGEDKEVEMQLIAKGIHVEYLGDADIYDEKVQRKEVFEKQRTRWLATQWNSLRPFLAKDMRVNYRKKIYLLKVFEWLLLPRLLLLVLFVLLLILCAIDGIAGLGILDPAWEWWTGLALGYGFTLLIAIPSSFYNLHTLKALLKIPVLMFAMLKALLSMRKNKAGFLHTPKEFSG